VFRAAEMYIELK